MRMIYDPESDALHIELCDGAPVDSIDYEEGVTADLDADGRVIGLEILDVRQRMEIDGQGSSFVADVRIPVPQQAAP